MNGNNEKKNEEVGRKIEKVRCLQNKQGVEKESINEEFNIKSVERLQKEYFVFDSERKRVYEDKIRNQTCEKIKRNLHRIRKLMEEEWEIIGEFKEKRIQEKKQKWKKVKKDDNKSNKLREMKKIKRKSA